MIDTDRHTAVVGITRSGKTYFADWMFRNVSGLAVYYNTQLEVKIEQSSDVWVDNFNDFRKAYNKGYRKICFNPNEDEEVALEELILLIDTLFSMGRAINKNAVETPSPFVHLFIDEAHEYSPKQSPNPKIDRVFKRGLRWGIVGVAISQRPAEVSHGILANCDNHVIFRCGDYEMPYFQRYKIPISKGKGESDEGASASYLWLKQKYHFVVYSEGEIEMYPPIEVD